MQYVAVGFRTIFFSTTRMVEERWTDQTESRSLCNGREGCHLAKSEEENYYNTNVYMFFMYLTHKK